MRSPDDTIAALSTPAGRAAIALVRLSGPRALECALAVFHPSAGPVRPGRARFGSYHSVEPASGDGETNSQPPFDEGYMTFFPAAHAYTGQDLVELSCHANPILAERLLEELVRAGARPAEAGEFTYRAVLNGKMDLAQAEGVRDLVEACTRSAATVACRQARGELSRRVFNLKDRLVEAICRAEAAVEFAEEPDVVSRQNDLNGEVRRLRDDVAAFVATYRQGRLLREGARVVLAGRPNAGKSSLFNRLLGASRAIVSEEPGTTRDFLVERVDWEGIPVSLIDTAGLRSPDGDVERQGVDRSRVWLEEADLVLVLCPAGEQLTEDDAGVLAACSSRGILVASKRDLGEREWVASLARLTVSSVTGHGLDGLRALVVRELAAAPAIADGDLLITNARHHAALSACAASLRRASAALADGLTEEVALADLHAALASLTSITEPVSLEDLYDRIFSSFCVGK